MAQNTEINKAELAQYVAELQSGDKRAFEKIYNVTYRSGYFTALKILQDEHEAQDVLQDSYIVVLEHIGELQDAEHYLGWFHQIVANRAKQCLAKRKPALFTSAEAEQEFTGVIQDEDIAVQPEQQVDDDDVQRLVMHMIDNLNDEKRTCVLLYYYNEMHVPEIAQAVGASVNTVKARLFQARKELRREIELLSRRKVALRGAAPASVVIWALRAAAQVETASFASSSAAVVVMESAAATASAAIAAAGTAAAGTAAAGTAGTAAASATGLLAKLAAMTVVQKVAVGVVTVGVVAGAATGTATVVNNIIENQEEETTEAQALTGETVEDALEEKYNVTMPTPPSTSRPTMPDRSTVDPRMMHSTQPMTQAAQQAAQQVEEHATTAAAVEETAAAETQGGYPNQQQNGNPFIPNGSQGNSNTRPNSGQQTARQLKTTSPTVAVGTTAPATAAQTQSNSGGGSYTPPTQAATATVTAQTQTQTQAPVTVATNPSPSMGTPNSANVAGKATVVITLTNSDISPSTVTGTVTEGQQITVGVIKSILSSELQGVNISSIDVNSVVGQTAESGQTYNYTVKIN